jgi:hypothetical protein
MMGSACPRQSIWRFAGFAALGAWLSLGVALAWAGPPTSAPEAKPGARAGKPTPAKPKAPNNSLDDALLDDLDNELLDGVKDLPKPPKAGQRPSPGQNADDASPADSPDDDAMTSDDANSAAPTGDDPLIRIGQEMRTLEKLIERQRAAEDTEKLQGQVLTELAELIKKLEQQSQCQSSSSSKPSSAQNQQASRDNVKQPKPGGNAPAQNSPRPAKESTDRLGKNETQKPDADAVKGLLKDAWGQLPPHAREQMLQSPPEEFLPKYELLIEKYYKRLADEQRQKP